MTVPGCGTVDPTDPNVTWEWWRDYSHMRGDIYPYVGCWTDAATQRFKAIIGNQPPLPPPTAWDRRYVEVPRMASNGSLGIASRNKQNSEEGR